MSFPIVIIFSPHSNVTEDILHILILYSLESKSICGTDSFVWTCECFILFLQGFHIMEKKRIKRLENTNVIVNRRNFGKCRVLLRLLMPNVTKNSMLPLTIHNFSKTFHAISIFQLRSLKDLCLLFKHLQGQLLPWGCSLLP